MREKFYNKVSLAFRSIIVDKHSHQTLNVFRADRTHLLCRNIELMKKLRHLWCSHKKYCTTTITPLRSYTPLSGYPHSRSSYDLDRTYYTSTPYTYRNRYQNDNYKINDDVRELTRHLSDLSIDKIGDSDDDPSKVRNYKKRIKF